MTDTTTDTITDKASAPRIPRTPLTVLGTGAMGTALVRAWLAAGHPVTVWNRTPPAPRPSQPTVRRSPRARPRRWPQAAC